MAELIINLEISHKSIPLPGGKSELITFTISESDAHWAVLSDLIKKCEPVNIVETVFSNGEIRDAEWLRLKSTFEQGYPQPKGTWPLKQSSYKIICPKCAIYNQTSPMRLAKEPHPGKKTFMSLIWATEIFCRPEVIQELKEINAEGFEDWDAIIHKTNKPSETVRQLYIPGVASPGVVIDDGLQRIVCPNCGTIKYYPHTRGIMYLKKEALPQKTDFILTHEWFGHGLLAWREILVSSRVANLILDKGWQGVRFKVVELV